MNITTQRLILRDLTEADTVFMYQMASDPEVVKYMDYIQFNTYADAEKWVKEKIYYNNQTPRFSYNFGILLKDTENFIGWIGIGDADDKKKGDADFGYALMKQYWGKGYMTEVLKEIIHIGFEKLGANKIFGQCHINNKGSLQVMEKAGMKFECTFKEDGKESARYSIYK